MSRKNIGKSYEQIEKKWSGILREGLSFASAVDKMLLILEPFELQIITGENATQISRARKNDGSLKLSSLKKIYEFYENVSKTPSEGSEDEDLVPIYSMQDVKRLINEGKTLKASIENEINAYSRSLLLTLRGIKDRTPQEKIDLKQISPQSEIKTEEQKNEKRKKVKIKRIQVTNNLDEKITLLTDDDKNYYFAPIKYSLESMRIVLRYTGKYSNEYDYLTLEERYLLEFYTLVYRVSMSDEESQKLSKALNDPQAFWELHAKYASKDNGWLRDKYGSEALKQKRLTTPQFESIGDVKEWVNRLKTYYIKHQAEICDKYENHSLEHIKKMYNIVLH